VLQIEDLIVLVIEAGEVPARVADNDTELGVLFALCRRVFGVVGTPLGHRVQVAEEAAAVVFLLTLAVALVLKGEERARANRED
jgi:hypothetical protein